MTITRQQAINALAGTALGARIAELSQVKDRNEFQEAELKGLMQEAERYITRQMA